MSTVNVKGTLLNPANQESPNTPFRLTSVLGYGDTLTSSTTVMTTDAAGKYDFDLVYGTHLVEVRFEDKYVKLGTVVVGSDIGPLTINELLLADAPVVPEYITTVLQAVVDARAAAAEANSYTNLTAADRVQTGLDATATAADRVQTGLDATATAADRVQTGLDTIEVTAKVAAMELLFDTFDDRYLGQKAVDPTTDNDGDPLVAGTVYFNTTTNTTRFYTGAIWEDPSVSSTNAASAALASQLAAAISEANANDSAVSANSDAGIATTKASEASDSAVSANSDATTSTEQATIATEQASEASSSEANASASEDAAKLSETNSANSEGIASSAAITATAQAVIATDKATEVANSLPQVVADISANTDAIATKIPATTTAISTGLNWDGVDYVDPDALGANPVAKIYPDGSIIGSTDNGNYTKYPNGNLVCSGNVLITTNDNAGTYFNYPFSFLDTTYTLSAFGGIASSGLSGSEVVEQYKFSGSVGRVKALVHTASTILDSIDTTIAWRATGEWK